MTPEPGIKLAVASDLQSFVGAELTGVTVWKFGVTLSFDNEPRTITVESGAEFRAQGRTEVYNQEIIVAFGARVLSLIGRRVARLDVEENNVLSFAFDDGSVFTLRPDSSGYESYTVNLPDGPLFFGIATQ